MLLECRTIANSLSPAAAEDVADALDFALRFQGRKRLHNANEIMSEIVAKRRPPPTGAFNGNQAMSILDRFIADHPETADKTYGLALSASLRQAFPCAPT